MSMDNGAESYLRKENTPFDQLFQASELPQLLVDPENALLLRANPAACRLLGADQGQFEGLPFHELLPSPRKKALSFLERATRETTATIRAPAPTDREGRKQLEFQGTALRIDDQHWVHVVVQASQPEIELELARDITDRNHAEQKQRTSEHMLQKVLEASPEGFWMGDFRTMETLEVNDAFCELLGRTRGELLGVHPQEWVDPADLEGFMGEVERRWEHNSRHFEINLLTRDGRRMPVVVNVVRFSDPEGNPNYSLAFVTDMSRLQNAEKGLDRLEDILEAFPGPVGLCDTSLKVLYHNQYAREILGIQGSGPTPAGKFMTEHTFHGVLEQEAVPAAIREGTWTGETELLDSKGCEHPFLLTLVAHRDQNGEVERFSTIGVDISGQKEAETREKRYVEQLNQVSRLISMGELVSILSHQLNQPLTAIGNYAGAGLHLASREGAMPSQFREVLEGVEGEARKAGDILSQIRNFLKGQGPELRPLDLNRLVQEVVPFICTGCSGEVPSIRQELAEDLPPVQADRIQLQEAIFNLARNGLDSCLEGNPDHPGPLVLSTRQEGDTVAVMVTDHGTGLPPNLDLDALEPFFSTKESGLGLGLWITRSIITAHGGSLDAWDNPDEPGATFRIRLPAAHDG